jgi:diaminopropionate ammonia-lyase
MCEYLINPHHQEHPAWVKKGYGAFGDPEVLAFHRSLPGYFPTPLHDLSGLAAKLGLKEIFVKDEGHRFGVKAFKPLGASYSVFRFLKQQWALRFGSELQVKDFLHPETMKKLGSYTFCAATDGNHGRAVAWTARKLNQQAVIYMPANTVASRIQNIKSEGAEVRLIDGTFDDCVKVCDRDARENNWQVIADTAYEGYMELPNYIMAGYSTIFYEMEGLINHAQSTDVDIVLVQAGVGGLAAAACWYYKAKYGDKAPKLVCVEPVLADSFMESAKHGEPRDSKQNYQSIMAGLNCGVSLVAFPVVKDAIDVFITVSDYYARRAMRSYFFSGSDPRIISGESGASGLAGLLALIHDDKLEGARKELKLGKDSRVLLINTEADTDPENYRQIIGQER